LASKEEGTLSVEGRKYEGTVQMKIWKEEVSGRRGGRLWNDKKGTGTGNGTDTRNVSCDCGKPGHKSPGCWLKGGGAKGKGPK
jgi:hypothetical protein